MLDKLNIEQLPPLGRDTISQALADWQASLQQQNLAVPQHPEFLDSVARVFYGSEFIRLYSLKKPMVLVDLVESGDLFSGDRRGQYFSALAIDAEIDENDLMTRLRVFRYREMIRIAWRDLAGWSDLDETLKDLTALAEVCIQKTLDVLYQKACVRRGTPTLDNGRAINLVVLGMGKLGAWELNYSSDIDLIFAFEEDGVLNDRKETTYGEFFTRLARSLVKMLDEVTAEGFVFRTDTRLRPFGDSGPLVMSFAGMENYYVTQAREWERYAMIKARQVAGDTVSGETLFEMIRPFVYRRYLDYGAFEELRALKTQINRELRRKDRMDNVKLGPGGIREIEFIGQAFQLIRGGQEPKLQQREIQKVLPLLSELEMMTPSETDTLLSAYRFLRRVENHIQEYQDRQTHDLPKSAEQQTILAFSLGFEDWDAFKQQLDAVRHDVQAIFDQVFSFSQNNEAAEEADTVWSLIDEDGQAVEKLSQAGFSDAVEVLKRLRNFRSSATINRLSAKAKTVLDKLMPEVIALAAKAENNSIALQRVLQLFEQIAGRNVYFALLQENPEALRQLIKLVAASSWITGYLGQYPSLLDELLDPRALYEPLNKPALQKMLALQLQHIPLDDEEQFMICLRHFKHQNSLRVAAADISGVIPLMVVSDYLTWIAEVVLDAVVDKAWHLLQQKHGLPTGVKVGEGFAVIGMGKLGGFELGYGSDLDLVFIYNCSDDMAQTCGKKPVTATQFYMRLGQKIRHILDARMLSGVLYETDLRLRPSGDSGLLVTKVERYRHYFENDAWTWEFQALVRGRFICGDAVLQQQFERIRADILSQPRDIAQLKVDVRDMREKMRANLAPKEKDVFHLKHSKGGIADIEFIVQFGVLAFAAENPALLKWTDNVRLLAALAEQGFLSVEEAQVLKTAYCCFRGEGHRRVLQGQKPIVPVARFGEQVTQVAALWDKIFS